MTEQVTWRVIDQRQTTAQDAQLRYVPVVAVTVQLSTGTVRTVNVPVAVYSVDTVRQAVEQAVEQTAAVDALEG